MLQHPCNMDVCRAQTDEDDMAGRKRRVRTKRGSKRNTIRLRNSRREARKNKRTEVKVRKNIDASRLFCDWFSDIILNCEQRTLGSHRSDLWTSFKHKIRKRRLKRSERNKEIQKNKQQNNKHVNQDYQRQQEQSQTRKPLGRFNKDFGIATLNVRSLYGPHKINELRNSMIKNNISLLLLQETKMIHYKDEAAIRDTRLSDGTRVIHSTAIAGAKGHGASGGLAILISPANASYITSTASITSRILYIKITQQVAGNYQTLHVYNVYAPGALATNASATQDFYMSLQQAISQHPQRDMIIIAGDFNAVLMPTCHGVLYSPSQSVANLNTSSLDRFLSECNLLAINTRFPKSNHIHNTFHGPKGRRQRLDFILTSQKWKSTFTNYTTFRAPFATDHKILMARGKFRFQIHRKDKPIPKPDWSALRDETIGQQITEYITSKYQSSGNLSDDYNLFARLAKEACATLPTISRRQRTHPWENSIIQEQRQQLSEARKAYRARPNKRNFRTIRARGKQLATQYVANQEQYLKEQCERIENLREEQQHKAAWDLINLLGNRKSRSQGNIQASSGKERLDIWKAHFERVFTEDTITTPTADSATATMQETVLPTVQQIFSNEKLAQLRRSYRSTPISDVEISYALETIRNGKASGADEISPELLKLPGLVGILQDILNRALNSGTVPELWQVQLLIPVPKKGDLSQCDNYRGIALMSLAAKLYDKILLIRLRNTLDKELRTTQNGFRPQRSTTQHTLALRILMDACKDHQNSPLAVVFIDFSKAFDSIKWDYLEAILGAYGIPDQLIKAVMSVYRGTVAKVRTSDGISDSFPLTKGVLQGDTLAPYLFIIVLDYILRQAIPDPSLGFKLGGGTSRTSKYIVELVYADDIATASSNTENAQQLLQAIERAALPIGLRINRPKTVAMFTPPSQTPLTPLMLSTGPIKWVTDFTYLGSLMESNVKDMKKRISKAWEAAKAIRNLWKSKLSDYTKTYLFRSLICSILLYGSEAWVLTKTQRKTYFCAYNSLLRYSLNIHFTTHTKTTIVYQRANIPTPACVLARRTLKFINRTLNGPNQPAKDALHWQHSMLRTTCSKRRISYQEQTLKIAGHKSIYSPQSKRNRIKETLTHLTSRKNTAQLIDQFSETLKSYEDIQGITSSSSSENSSDEEDAMETT